MTTTLRKTVRQTSLSLERHVVLSAKQRAGCMPTQHHQQRAGCMPTSAKSICLQCIHALTDRDDASRRAEQRRSRSDTPRRRESTRRAMHKQEQQKSVFFSARAMMPSLTEMRPCSKTCKQQSLRLAHKCQCACLHILEPLRLATATRPCDSPLRLANKATQTGATQACAQDLSMASMMAPPSTNYKGNT